MPGIFPPDCHPYFPPPYAAPLRDPSPWVLAALSAMLAVSIWWIA